LEDGRPRISGPPAKKGQWTSVSGATSPVSEALGTAPRWGVEPRGIGRFAPPPPLCAAVTPLGDFPCTPIGSFVRCRGGAGAGNPLFC